MSFATFGRAARPQTLPQPQPLFRLLPLAAALSLLAAHSGAQAADPDTDRAADPSVTAATAAPAPSAGPDTPGEPAASSTSADASAPAHLDTIVVTANPLGRTADELAQPVDVVDRQALQRRRSGTLGETLENRPGIATTDFGQGAGRPVIRGLAGPRVEILDNGLSTMDASDLSPDHAVAIDPAHAQRIEVLKGPATLLYGNAASGGAVNVIDDRMPTEVNEGLHGNAELEYGNNGDMGRSHTELDYGHDRHQLHADFSWREAGNYSIPGPASIADDADHAHEAEPARGVLLDSDVRTTSGAASYSFIGDEGDVYNLSYSRFDSQYGLPGHAPHEAGSATEPTAPTGFIELGQNRYDGRALLNRPFSGFESLSLRAGYSDYTHTEFEAPGEPGTVFLNDQLQGRIEAVHEPLSGFRGVIGLQLTDRDFQAIGDEAYVPPVQSQSVGVFVVEERPLRLGRFEVGARIERNQTDPQSGLARDFTPLSLSLGQTFDLGEHSHLKLYLTQAQRSPVQEELYAFGPHAATSTYERGNTRLDIERFRNLELGFDHHRGPFSLIASVYYNQASDYIYLAEVDQGLNADGSGTAASDGEADRVDGEGVFTSDGEFLLVDYNQADATLYGYELQAGLALISEGDTQLTLSAFTDSVRAELDSGGNLPRITPRRHGVGVDASRGPLSGSVQLVRVEAQSRLAAFETPTAGYAQLNASLGYRLLGDGVYGKTLEVFVRGTNLLDEDIRRATSFVKDTVPAPGRSLFAGLRIGF